MLRKRFYIYHKNFCNEIKIYIRFNNCDINNYKSKKTYFMHVYF